MTVSCDKDEKQSSGEVKSFDKFILKEASFKNQMKSYVDYDYDNVIDSLSRILYEEGDVIYVNGHPFSLYKEEDHWVATADQAVTAETFYIGHVDGAITSFSSPNYTASISDNNTTTTGIVMAGSTNTNVITLSPCFAVLLFKPADISQYTSVRVGFDYNSIPRNFTINASLGQISASSSYFSQASSGDDNTLLTMKKTDNSGNSLGYYYIAVPIRGNSVNTKLYIMYTKSGTPYYRVTESEVTLSKGKVYIIPSEDMSQYPFDENGASKHVFSVSASQTVKFSAGNLQCQPTLYGGNKGLRFAPHQYDIVGEADNQNVGAEDAWGEPTCNHYFDLFGWATSGQDEQYPYLTSTANSAYYAGSVDNDFYTNTTSKRFDWGYLNYNKIWYGNKKAQSSSSNRWRTLQSSEWYYLLNTRANASSLRGYATINGTFGFVILPDDWDAASYTDVSFTANALNTYSTTSAWAKMEKHGAIFLPACGSRLGATQVDDVNTSGYYWSSTHDDNTKCYSFSFSNGSFNAQATRQRRLGSAVRLVINAN